MRTAVLAAVAALLLMVPGMSATTTAGSEAALVFQTDMHGEDQVPPVDTVAWGFVRFFFNEDRSHATYTVDVKSLSNSLVSGADIHRGAPGTNGPVVHHLADGNFIVTSGELSLTAAELQEMASGVWYVSLKTYAHPDGELRGQIVVPANFLPKSAVAVASPVPSLPAPQAPATQPSGTIRPPATGDAGLAGGGSGLSGLAVMLGVWLSLAVLFESFRLARAFRP